MALALFAITLFVSAFILFLVQPIIGKTILPKLGGTPQVWNTCMVFFQAVLLLGYFYTHASSNRLSLRRQLIVHCALLFIPFLFLLPFGGGGPFNIDKWIPPLGANPLTSTLVLLFAVVGVPFFVVSTSAPLLQKWFGGTGHPAAKDPYFLYGASNLGSMLALVLYPIAIEPFMDLTPQKWMWTVGYGVLLILVLACAAMIWKTSGVMAKYAGSGIPVEPASEGQPVPPPVDAGTRVESGITTAPPPPPVSVARSTAFKKGKPQFRPQGAGRAPAETLALKTPSDEMTTWRRLRWIGLAFVPSSLMLGVTTHITTDLSPIPLFWLIPLTIYLASFILVFSKWPVTWVDAPHTYMLYLQPVLICLMIFIDISAPFLKTGALWGPLIGNVLAFGATALVCHGELAKDRPGTKHLTEFYLLMSVGGVLGGIFNGIIAPVIFIYVWEFGIAVVCACLLRPKLKDSGWTDEIFSSLTEQPAAPAAISPQKGPKGQPIVRSIAKTGPSQSTTRVMDVVLPVAIFALLFVFSMVVGMPVGTEKDEVIGMKLGVIFGIPLTIAAFYYGRPLRFGLAVMVIMIFHQVLANRGDASLYADRSYFGVLRVKFGHDIKGNADVFYTQLIHGHINHGMNIFHPDNKADWGKADKDYSRLATTYYHRFGPAGIVMEKFNWFPGPQNTYWGDARMPATLVAQATLPLGTGILPMGQLVDLWSEPPFATIGLGTGTMATYGRLYQHVHYYEIDNHVRRMSLPITKKDQYYFTYENLPQEIPFTHTDYLRADTLRTYFNSLKEAIHRGCEVEVLMGDARLRMNLPYKNMHVDHLLGGGPESFYHMMVVDAFSSDAIPVHLITKEALEMYFKHLTEEGILCVHTSNRYVDLPLVVAAVASDLGYAYRRGHDQAPGKELGRFTSEWVMVARKDEYLQGLKDPPDYASQLREAKIDPDDPRSFYWTTPIPNRKYLWTDDHSNLWNVIR